MFSIWRKVNDGVIQGGYMHFFLFSLLYMNSGCLFVLFCGYICYYSTTTVGWRCYKPGIAPQTLNWFEKETGRITILFSPIALTFSFYLDCSVRLHKKWHAGVIKFFSQPLVQDKWPVKIHLSWGIFYLSQNISVIANLSVRLQIPLFHYH